MGTIDVRFKQIYLTSQVPYWIIICDISHEPRQKFDPRNSLNFQMSPLIWMILKPQYL